MRTAKEVNPSGTKAADSTLPRSGECSDYINLIYYQRRVSQAARRKANERSKVKVTEGGFTARADL
jgi:hypothetical protein